MGRKTWDVNIDGEHHAVLARWSPWTAAGEILVDGKAVDLWGPRVWLGLRRFKVSGEPAFLRWPSTISQKCELFVDGVKVGARAPKA